MTAKGITVLENAIEDCDVVIIASISGNSSVSEEDIPEDIDIAERHFSYRRVPKSAYSISNTRCHLHLHYFRRY